MREFRLLGGVSIENGGQPAEVISSDKSVALLAYLIYTRERQTREHVADLLWETDSTTRSLKNLRNLLSKVLRRAAPELLIEPKHLSFVAGNGVYVDLNDLDEALNDGDVEQLDRALQLYQGDFLGGFHLRDAPRFNEWLVSAQELLRQRVLIAYDTLCTEYLGQGKWRKAAAVAHRWRLVDTLNEEALRYLLRGLVADGQFGAAQQHYLAFRTLLLAEMGLEPEPQTLQLVAGIEVRRAEMEEVVVATLSIDELTAELDISILSDIGPLPPQSILPYPRNNLFEGRHEELLRLASALAPRDGVDTPNHPAAAITGMGGLGKSQLAVEFAYRYGRYFPGGVYWISFAEAQEVAERITETGGANGLSLFLRADNLTQTDKLGRIMTAWQEPIPRLLIFDNCEEEALLSQWMPVSGGCSVLITSRKSAWPQELSLTELSLAQFQPTESLNFLQQLMPELAPAAGLAIAAELGHLPLALHLSGRFLHRYTRITPDRYLDQLRNKDLLHHPSLSGYGADFSPTGHELSVARTFALSWDQLDPEDEIDRLARHLLATIVQFAPGEPISRPLLVDLIIAADTADLWAELRAEDSLLRLVSLGFIRLSGTAFVTIHRLVVSFVQNASDRALQVERQAAVAAYLIALVKQHRETEGVALYTLPVASTHFRYVTDKAIAQDRLYALALMGILGDYFNLSDLPAARLYLADIADTAVRLFGVNSPQMIYALSMQVDLYVGEGQLDNAYALGSEALDRCAELGIHLALDKAKILGQMGYVAIRRNEVDAAKSHIQAALDIYQPLFGDSSEYVGDSLKLLGSAYAIDQDYKQALVYALRAVDIFRHQFGETHAKVGDTYSTIGSIYGLLGDFAKLEEFCGRALQVNEAIFGANSMKVNGPLTNLGVVYWRRGDYQKARVFFERVLNIARQHYPADHYMVAEAQSNVAEVLCKMGQFEEAMTYHQEAYQIRCAVFGEEHFEALRSLSMIGEVRLRIGEIDTAVEILTRCGEMQATADYNLHAIADTHVWLGEALQAKGDFIAAEGALLQALPLRQKAYGASQPETVQVLLFLGQVNESAVNLAKAQHFYQQGIEAMQEAGIGNEHPLAQELAQRLKNLGQA